jgi:hypothetical protein
MHVRTGRAMKRKAKLEPHLKVYKIMTIPTATCGSEKCFVKKNHETRIQAVEMKFLRTVIKYTRTDHKYNTAQENIKDFSL